MSGERRVERRRVAEVRERSARREQHGLYGPNQDGEDDVVASIHARPECLISSCLASSPCWAVLSVDARI